MEQSEFNATQAINEACYQLVKAGYSMRDVHAGLVNVMDAMGFNHPEQLSTEPLTIAIDVDTTEAQRVIKKFEKKLKQLKSQGDFYNAMDN